jgi:hypothetical protein
MTSLPSPGELFLNDIEKIILNFFWDDKPAKIKKNILFKEKTEGGLNLTNINIYAKSVKFQWIYKLYNEDYNAFWKDLICAHCSRLQDKIIWKSNLNLKDAHKLVIKSKCWQDLLVWYSSLNFNDDSNKVTNTDFIWYNSHLKINDRVLNLKCMSENGIKKIEDLIDDNNRFLTYQMFLDKCNVNINAITYYGIIIYQGQYEKASQV